MRRYILVELFDAILFVYSFGFCAISIFGLAGTFVSLEPIALSRLVFGMSAGLGIAGLVLAIGIHRRLEWARRAVVVVAWLFYGLSLYQGITFSAEVAHDGLLAGPVLSALIAITIIATFSMNRVRSEFCPKAV